MTGPTIAATRDNVGAFVQALNSEIEGAVRDMKRSVNRQLHSDGRDALAFWTTADDSSGTNVDDNRGNGFTHLPAGTLTCDLIDATDHSTKLGDSIVVTRGAITSTQVAITWTGTVSGSADTDYLVLEDTLGNQMMGIEGVIDDANPPLLAGGLHGINRSTAGNEFWKAQVVEGDTAGTNQDLTQPRMQKPLDLISTSSDFTEQDVEFMLCSYGVRAKYAELCIANKYQVNTLELDGGFKGLDYNGIPLIPDPQCKKNRIYYVVPQSMRIFRTSDFDWADRDGSMLNRVANKDAYEAFLFHYGNLGALFANANGLLDDISE